MLKIKTFISLLSVSCVFINGFCSGIIQIDSLVQKFYSVSNQPLYWLSSGKDKKKAAEWLTVIGAANPSLQVNNKPAINKMLIDLKDRKKIDFNQKQQIDQDITGLILNYLKVLQEGTIIFDYDEIRVPRDSVYINQLLHFKRNEPVSGIVTRLGCQDPDYLVLESFLRDSITPYDTVKYKSVLLAMNYLRYLNINHQSEYIIVNLPEAEAKYFRNGFLQMQMRTVVGRKKNPTPRIASYMTSIVTFPYWNVPHSIAVKELLPKVKKNENYLEQNNFEIVDAKGNQIEDSDLNWENYNENNFPYYFRQATGSDNSLGVLKFNLQNPYSIFLHSTSVQSTFSKDFRFLSHGCIRLEKPLELANALLRGKIDLAKLESGRKDIQPGTLKLPARIPVFIIYMPVKVEGKKITFLKDVYGLIK